MSINRVNRGKVVALAGSGSSAGPTKPFNVERIESAAAAQTPFEPAPPVSERVIESTRHLQGLVPEADLQAIRETLVDKLEADPMFVDLLNLADSGGR